GRLEENLNQTTCSFILDLFYYSTRDQLSPALLSNLLPDLRDISARESTLLSTMQFVKILAFLVLSRSKDYTDRIQRDLDLLGVVLPLKMRVESILGTPSGTMEDRAIEINVDIIATGIASIIEEIEKKRNILEESDQHSLKNYINFRFLTIPASF
ncbi:LOW QUALITY PROTEIN: hypothetical protein MXB_4174, partial [Myxobolus squamalis]